MRLIYTVTSPYARKIRIAILEKKLEKEITCQCVSLADDAILLQAINPLGKVPALITSDGDSLYDSPVICEFVDGLSSVSPLIPGKGKARFDVLCDQALADGVMDIAVSMVLFKVVSGEDMPHSLVERHMDTLHRALNQMENRVASFGDAFDLGQISCLAAIDYLNLRFSDLDWKVVRPNLAAWYKEVSRHDSVVLTRPQD